MDLIELEKLEKDFKELKLKKGYFFYGEEYIFKSQLIKIIKQNPIYKNNPFDLLILDAENSDVGNFIMDCSSAPMNAPKKIVILKKTEKLKIAQLKELFGFYKELPDFTTAIILYEKNIKKNEPINNLLDSGFLNYEFGEFSESQAEEFAIKLCAQNAKNMDRETANLLISIVGTSPSMLYNEIEKICLYNKEKQNISRTDVVECVSVEKEENIYRLTELILYKDKKSFIELMEKMIDSNIEPMNILYILLNSIEKIWKMSVLIRNGMDNDFRLLYSLGVFSSEIRKFKSHMIFDEEKIIKLLKRCLEAEYFLKTSSNREPKILIKNLSLEIIRSV